MKKNHSYGFFAVAPPPTGNTGPGTPVAGDSLAITPQQIAEMIDSRISSLRIYVLESDITEAQNNVRSIVELASF